MDNVGVNALLRAMSAQADEASQTHWLGISESKHGRKEAAGVVSGLINVLPFALLLTRLGPLALMLPAVLRVAASPVSISVLVIISASVTHDPNFWIGRPQVCYSEHAARCVSQPT